MATESKTTAATTTATAPEKRDGFQAVTLYDRFGNERVAETVAAKVQLEFEGWSETKPKK